MEQLGAKIHDVDRQSLDRMLEEHQILMETVQQSPVHFCVYDGADRLIAWNKAYEANYPNAFRELGDDVHERGVTYADLMRHELSLTMSSEDVEAEIERRVRMQAEAQGAPVIRRYGEHVLRVHKYRLPSGAVAGLAVDISDLIEREDQLREAQEKAQQSEAAKARFLANMSHEIRTPMNGIMGLTEVLEDTGLNAEQADLVRTIKSSAEALLSTINEVLDFSKIDAGKLDILPDPFDFSRLIQEVIGLLQPVAEQKGLALILQMPPGDALWVIGDALRIRQCLLNLLGNAIKFTLEGSVTLSVSLDTDHMIRIAVQDTGIGIAQDSLDKVFSAFEQVDTRKVRRFEGTGLGLAITRRLIELMGGEISVRSRIGVGTTFTVSIPLPVTSPAAAGALVTKRSAGSGDLSNLRVLLAEDNQTNRLVVTKMLEGLVGEILIAKDGRAAVDAFATHDPDLILMDVSMPQLSGLDAAREIRAIEQDGGHAPVPIIALTANAMTEDRDACLGAGMDDFLTKPIHKTDLIEALAAFAVPRTD